MLLAFWVILLAVSFWILISVYSMFFPFFENLKNISEYNSAYYAAISSVERWELVLRYKNPWFQGTGGFVGTNKISWWPDSDNNSDFGVVNNPQNWMRWNISSRTKNIPNLWWWNVDFMLANSDSSDYNMIGYFQKENFILDVDDTVNPNQYYNSWGSMKSFSGWYISGSFRLPPKIFEWLTWWIDGGNLLCDDSTNTLCDVDKDKLFDEVVVNRSLDWTYNSNNFSIIPNRSVNYNYNPVTIDFTYDNAIRESLFDDRLVNFSTSLNDFSPVGSAGTYLRLKHSIIWKQSSSLQNTPFNDLLKRSDITWLVLKFSLFDLLRTRNGDVYPFLEYQFEFPELVSDRFYNIQWVGKVWDYDIYINVNKPTSNDSSIWDFAIIF